MACQYLYNNKVYSYEDLLKEITSSDLEKALSILYSLQVDKQSTTVDTIQNLKKEYKAKYSCGDTAPGSSFNFDEDGDILVGAGYTTQTFIDSGHFNLDGEAPGFRMDVDKYLDIQKDMYKKQGFSDDDADYKCQLIKSRWDSIAKDATDLHRILLAANSNTEDREFQTLALKTSFQGIYDQLGSVVRRVLLDIWKRNHGSTLISNVGLEAKIKNIAETMVGHIDYLFVRPDGDIDIYNLKVSKDAELDWSSSKKDKYKYQLAFIKRILEYNGINAKNIRVNLVPVKLDYDDNFENILGISTQPPKSYDSNGVKYTLQQYDNIVSQYIDSNVTMEDLNDDVFIDVNNQLSKIFVGRDVDIRHNGIQESAKGWVKQNWNHIAKLAVGKKGWEIKFPGEKNSIYIENTKVGADNEDVVNMVADREEQLFGNEARQKGTYRIVQDVKKSFEDKLTFFGTASKDRAAGLIQKQLDKYFLEYDELDADGKVKNYKWRLIDNDTLTSANMLLFQHKETGQLDVVTFTPFDVSVKVKAKGRDNLLGYYLPDMNKENFMMESNYGNIEAIRTMTLLNAIIPKLGFLPKLGQLKIIGLSPFHKKSGKEFVISQLLPQFDTIVKTVKENNNTLSFQNNFKSNNVLAVDPARVVVQMWQEAISDHPEYTRDLKTLEKYIRNHTELDGTMIDGLQSISTVEGKLEKLHQILDAMKDIDPLVAEATPEELVKMCEDPRIDRKCCARVYTAALRAINMYNGDLSIENEEFSSISEYFFKPQIIPNTNVRTVGYMFQRSIDKISGEMLDRYSPIRDRILKYFKDKGYSTALNSLVGNHASQFSNLYETDFLGNKTMNFKNPYDPSSNLSTTDREFLKDILFELNKVRFEMRGDKWIYDSPNDSKLINAVNNNDFGDSSIDYLAVPLMRVSDATKHEDIGKRIKDFGNRWMKRIMHPQQAFKEFTEGMMSEDDKKRRDDDIRRLQAYNPFTVLEMSSNARSNYIADKGTDYFETDLETIMINFMEKHIQSTEFNKMLTRTKGILLDLQFRGIAEDDPEGVAHTVKTINDYLSVSVFNKSIMEESSQAIESFLDPIRKAVSKCYIAANPTAMVRDTVEGLLLNITKSLIKFLTDIDVKDVMYGYKDVITEGPGNLMKITKLNQLNLKYRFSNLDIARISEGLKTSGGGVLNAQNWAYVTLRAPDYLNRMVLFSARMHHDGTEDAYYIKDGKLVYDWTKDHRFDVYRQELVNNPEYNKQRSLYLSLLRIFNQENGTDLHEGDALPDAYTAQQISQFKNFADNIYGSYNQSTRAKYENIALGRNFGFFSTWMNGIVDVYFKLRQLSKTESRWEQEKDSNGNLLFFDKDGNILAREYDENGLPITMPGDAPVMQDIPLEVLGVIYTLQNFGKEWYNNGFDAAKKDIWGNPVNQRNLRRLFADMFVWLMLGAAFKLWITPSYSDHKTNGRGQDVIKNGLIELTYNSFHNAYDGFKGPFAVLDYVGTSTNPSTYKLPTKVFNDLGSFVMGNKTFTGLLMGSQALPRAFRDSYRMYVRDTK